MEDVLQNLRLFYDDDLQELHKRLPPAPRTPYLELVTQTARLNLPEEQRMALLLAELRLDPSPRKRP